MEKTNALILKSLEYQVIIGDLINGDCQGESRTLGTSLLPVPIFILQGLEQRLGFN